jgi:type I restriction enzyme S subunit
MTEVRSLRAYAEVTLGRQRSPGHETGAHMVPYLRAANVKDGCLDLTDVKEMNFSPAEQRVFSLRPGDVLVTEGSGSLGSVGASTVFNGDVPSPVCFQNTLLRLRPREQVDARFLAWWCRHAFAAGVFASVATGANIHHLSADRVRRLPVTYVPLRHQRAIADHLDTETARIDALIESKRQLIGLIEERWAASLRWLAHDSNWPWVPLRRLWTVTDCKHVTPVYVPDGVPVVSPGDVKAGRIDLGRCHRFVDDRSFADLTSGGRRPVRGDIVYSRNASIGVASYVDTDEPFTMGQDVCLIRSTSQSQLWLTYMLNSVGVDQLQEMKIGSTFDRVNIRQLLELRIPAPDPSIQSAEAVRLDAQRSQLDALRSALSQQINTLQEHRQALITAAVTGELDIPGAA